MKFHPISIDEYVKMHLAENPSENEKDYRERINSALEDYKNGEKCSCGNDIWVIGSAVVGNSCFTCITGESQPDDDYEIDSAVIKSDNKRRGRHIDDMDPTKIKGIFDDDGNMINFDFF